MLDPATFEMRTAEYMDLVAQRKKCSLCALVGLQNPAMAGLAEFDSDEIGPWTRWLGDRMAKLMIVGEDWGGVEHYKNHKGFDDDHTNRAYTNQRLKRLLDLIGIQVSSGERKDERSGVFLTNAVLCIKDGRMQDSVDRRCFDNCREFLRRQIEIVSPAVVVTLGKRAYKAVAAAFKLRSEPTLRPAVEDPHGQALWSACRLLPVYHCGNNSTHRNRSEADQRRDWMRVLSEHLTTQQSDRYRFEAVRSTRLSSGGVFPRRRGERPLRQPTGRELDQPAGRTATT